MLARFVKITSAANQYLQVSELAVWTSGGVNVAIGKPCTSSPPYESGSTCNWAFQGVYSVKNYPNIYHSAELGAFMQVDLGGNFNIVRVDYYNRGLVNAEFIIGARVELMDASSVVLATQTVTTTTPATTTASPGTLAEPAEASCLTSDLTYS